MTTKSKTPRTDAMFYALYNKRGDLGEDLVIFVRTLMNRAAHSASENARLREALERLVAVHDMGGNEGPYANPDAVAHYLTEARAALVQS